MCKCGEFKIPYLASGKYLAVRGQCAKKECNPKFGIKRPEHSKTMKLLAAEGNNEKYNATLMKKGELFNKEVNSKEFKKKVLIKKGIDFNENNLETQFGKIISDRSKSREYRENIIFKFYQKNKIEDISLDQIKKLNEKQFSTLFKKYKSDHHEIYCADVCVARTFKRTLLENLKCNISGLTSVYTRSSYETNYIKYFEQHRIKWDYESLKFKLPTKTYKPDFFVKFKNKRYIIETKGFLIDEDKYFKENVYPLLEILKTKNIEFIFSYKSVPDEDFEKFLEEDKINC